MDQVTSKKIVPAWVTDLLVVLVVIGGVHLTKLDVLALRGEESRWTTVAIEMRNGGDWIVPRQQGEPFLSRPPLGSWLIALSGAILGEFSPLAVRLPSALATLAIGVMLYAYGRKLTGSRVAGLVAAIAYPTMGHVLQLGRLAESESVFTTLIAGSLLSWHLLRRSGAPEVVGWCVGYGLAALAALTKGPQGPVYFLSGVGLYLIARGEWRRLLAPAHFVGIAIFAAVLLAWQIPFALRTDLASVRAIWSGDTLLRFETLSLVGWLGHLVVYPVEVLACTAPWSFLVAVYVSRGVRDRLGESRDAAVFAACAIAPALLSCWIVPNSRGRYFMPLYPLVAVLAGVAADVLFRADAGAFARDSWQRFARFGAVGAVLCALGMVAAQLVPGAWLNSYRQPAATIAIYVVGSLAAAAILFLSARGGSERRGFAGALALAGFLGLTGTFLGVDVNHRASEDTRGAVDRLKGRIPDSAQLVSFGVVHHVFAYHYGRPIELRPWVATRIDDADLDYFCYEFVTDAPREPNFPFAWERIAEVSNERYHRDHPRFYTVVGRRIAESVAEGSGSALVR